MILVGITGRAGSGKDTVGDILREKYTFATVALARPIQKIVCNLLGYGPEKWADREWREAENELYGCSPRRMAQTLGTEWGRNAIKPTLWLDLALHSLSDEDFEFVAFTDVRFANEANYIRQAGGHVIHVHRADLDAAPTVHRSHASEQGVGTPATQDFHVNNFGTFEQLEEQVSQVVARILELQQDALEQAEETQPDEKV